MSTFDLLTVVITRGRDEVVAEVPEHEIPVLEAVHGAANVRVEGKADETIDLDADAEAEFIRLQQKYQRLNATDPALAAYPRGARDLESAGFVRAGGRREVPQAGVYRHKKAEAAPDEGKPAKAAK